MPRELKIKFDRHGLGDCVHFAHALQLYKRRGYDVTVQVEANKLFIWKVAGVNIVQGGDLPDHSYHYPAGFDDLNAPDHEKNKVAFGLKHDVMPSLSDLGLTSAQAWEELCEVRLSAHDHISSEAHAEADRFLEGMPRPIICLHSRGTNWHERKSLPTDIAFDVILKLLDQTNGSVIVLDYDRRAPMVGDARCKGIKPGWGHIGIDRLCALFERSDLVIGVDSGPFHVAALTDVKALGVFRSLHPNRVCLPNPNAVYLVNEAYQEQIDHPDPWKLATYAGPEPTADGIVLQAIDILEGLCPSDEHHLQPEEIPGRYLYMRVGHDKRIMELIPGGRIGEGAEGCERQWELRSNTLSISGKDGVICRLRRDQEHIWRGRWTQFEKMPIELVPIDQPDANIGFEVNVYQSLKDIDRAEFLANRQADREVSGEYFCEFIGSREFPVSLRKDGTADSPDQIIDAWQRHAATLRLLKESRVISSLDLDPDDCWRGSGPNSCHVELISASRQPFRSFGPTEPIKYKQNEYIYTSVDTFSRQCVKFARSLPAVRAIAGVPRSGLLAATLMATELNCPMIPIESLMNGEIPEPPVPRRGRGSRFDGRGMILVIDDNCSSGRVISSLRPKLHPDVKIGVILGNSNADFVHLPIVRDVHQSYQWTILHDDNAEWTLTDLDGVLCEDWTGGDETQNLSKYLEFLQTAKPRRVPSYPLMGIVTNRLEQHRSHTEEWLTRHGIRYRQLIMSQHSHFSSRDAANDAAIRKAEVYVAMPKARLFIESCGKQAREIRRLSGRPVLSIEDNHLV